MKKAPIGFILLLLLSTHSCIRSLYVSPYNDAKSDCGKLVLKPLGKAKLIKCGEILWEEKGQWTRKNDTIRVQFRNYFDFKMFVVKNGKLVQILPNNSITPTLDKKNDPRLE